jgi:transposase
MKKLWMCCLFLFNKRATAPPMRRDSDSISNTLYDAQALIRMEYEQRVIIKFLFNNGLDPRQILKKLEAQFHENVYSLPVVHFWIGEVRRGREDLHDEPRPGRRSEEHITAKIQELLDQNPFESPRSIAETLHISHSTVLKHLHDDLHFQSFYIRWVPHMLTPELTDRRSGYTREMIPVLTAAVRDGWHHLVTGDESWFFLSESPR